MREAPLDFIMHLKILILFSLIDPKCVLKITNIISLIVYFRGCHVLDLGTESILLSLELCWSTGRSIHVRMMRVRYLLLYLPWLFFRAWEQVWGWCIRHSVQRPTLISLQVLMNSHRLFCHWNYPMQFHLGYSFIVRLALS